MNLFSFRSFVASSKFTKLARGRHLKLDSLEDRSLPATYSLAGTALTVTLNSANETVTWTAGPSSISVAGSNAAVDGGGLGTDVTLVGNNATISSNITSISVIDTANNGTMAFADSGTNVYAPSFTITLDNTGSTLQFEDGTSTFSQDFIANAKTSTADLVGDSRVIATGTANFALNGTTETTLPSFLSVGGNLNVTSSGATGINQRNFSSDSGLHVVGNATFTAATASNQVFTLHDAANSVAGSVIFNQTTGTIAGIDWLNASSIAQTPNLSALGALTFVELNHPNAAIVSPAINVTGGGFLILTAFGDITQTGALTNTGLTSLKVLGNSAITLSNAGNNFGGLTIWSSASTQLVSITEANAISITQANLGRAGLSLNAIAGNITQTGGITQLPAAGPITTNTAAVASSVTLANPQNRFGGSMTIGGTPTTVSIRDSNSLASTSNLSLPSGVTTLTIRYDNAPLTLGAFIPSTVTSLTANGLGIYQSAPLTITTVDANGNSGPVLLDKPANDFGTLRFRTSTTGGFDVSIADANGIILGGGISSLGSGRLNVVSTTGNITQANSINSAALSVASFNAPAGAVTLTNAANSFLGRVEAAVGATNTLQITNSLALTLGNITTASGTTATFVASTGAGNFQQYPGTKLNLQGPSTFTSGSGVSNLTNPGNQIAGAISFSSTGTFNVSASGDITLDSVNSANLNVTAYNTTGLLGGNINQTSNTVLSSGVATFNAGLSAGNVTLNTAGNNFNTVGGRVNGTGNFSVTDANALVLGSTVLGNGSLTLNAGSSVTQTGGGVQASGSGLVTLKSGTNGTINFNNSANEYGGAVTVLGSPNTLSLANRGNLDLASVAPQVSATANLSLFAGKTLSLPASTLNVTSIVTSASKILLQGNISTTGAININGDTTISGPGTFTVGSASFSGNITITVPVTFNTAGGLIIQGGNWSQGSNSLNVSGGGLTINGVDTRFITSGNTAITLGSGNLTVQNGSVFQVGTQAAVAESATVTTSGDIVFNTATLQVGLGATTDRLIQAGTGNVTLDPSNTTLVGTGIATTPQPVITVTGGGTLTAGSQFSGSFDPSSLDPIPFKAGTDVVLADYTTTTTVTIGTGQASDPDGTVTGYLQNGQAYSVSSTLGAAAGLVVVEKTDALGNDLGLDIVVRSNNAASTITVSPSPTGNNGPGTILIHSISVSGTGSVTINAPLADLVGGGITTQGTLTALKLRNITSASIITGGLVTGSTTISAKEIADSVFEIGGVLTSLSAANVSSNGTGSRFVAEKFGTIKTIGSAVQGTPPGDFNARLTTRTSTLGVTVATVSVAGTLSGVWDVFGDIGTVTTSSSDTWNLGASLSVGGRGVRNPDGVRNVTSLNIGRAAVGAVNLNATGNVKSLKTTDWLAGAGRFGSIGSLVSSVNTLIGADGNLTVGIVVTGNTLGTAIGTISVAGVCDFSSSQLSVRNGNIGSIVVGKSLSGAITATTGTASGAITSLSAGTISGLTLDAKRIGTLSGVANYAQTQFGDIGSSANTFTLRGNDGTTLKNAIGTIKATRNLTSNTFNLLAGNIGSVTVGYRSSSNTFNLPDATAGRIGAYTAGESTGDVLTVESIGSLTAKGVPASAANTTALIGNLTSLLLTSYRQSGIAVGTGSITAKGGLASSVIISPNGIGVVTTGRSISSTTINTDSPLTGTDVIGRIGTIKAGSISILTLTAESLGTLTTTGFLTPESSNSSKTPGVVNTLTLLLKGSGTTSGVGLGTFSADSVVSGSSFFSPYGITTFSSKSSLSSVSINTDVLPLAPITMKPGFGKIGTITGADFVTVKIVSDSVGTLKSLANYSANARGSLSQFNLVMPNTGANTPAIGTISVAGNIDSSSLIDAPGGMTSLTVDESITNATIAAGYLATKGIGTIKAGDVSSSTIVSRQLGSFNIVGNLEPSASLGGGISGTFINIFGNNAGVGLGTFSALGTVADTVFDITDGNLTSFTAARLRESTIQVGARFTRGNTLANGVIFGTTDRVIGTLKLTAPTLGSSPSLDDFRDAAGFRDSYVAAAKIGTVTVTNAAWSSNPTVETQGVAFKTAAATSGIVNIGGITVADNTVLSPASKFAKTGI